MATLYQCDGCDRQTRDRSEVSTITVDIKDREQDTHHCRDFDLCGMCLRRFRETLPNAWARNKGA